jgi:glycosyltransferase involved in cell wall biosynthesis
MHTQKNDILLTIAVPTYNRIECLKDLLPELLQQCKLYPEIEILISDNCSTDGTAEYVTGLAAVNSQVRYSVNSVNVGADTNLIVCVENARGKYVWLFGDDEVLFKGTKDRITGILGTYLAPLIVVGFDHRLGYSESQFFAPFRDYVNSINPNQLMEQTLITCNIFLKNIFNLQIARRRIMSNQGHMYAIFESLKKQGSVNLVSDQIFTVNDYRAPTDTVIKTPLLKSWGYTLYLGISYPKMLIYCCRYTIGIPYRRIFHLNRRSRYDGR